MVGQAVGSSRSGGVLVRDPRTGAIRDVSNASVAGAPEDEQRVRYRLKGGGGKGSDQQASIQGPEQQVQSVDPEIERQRKIQKILTNPRLPLSVRQAQVRSELDTRPKQVRTFKGVPVYDRPVERVVTTSKEDSVSEKLQRQISQEETNALRNGFTIQGQIKAGASQFALEGIETGKALGSLIRNPIGTTKAVVENRGQIIQQFETFGQTISSNPGAALGTVAFQVASTKGVTKGIRSTVGKLNEPI